MKKKEHDLKDLTLVELQDKLQEERSALGKLRFNHAVSPVESPAQLRTKRKSVARILTERNLHKTQVGAIAITCAAVDDVSAWCMLAFVVGVARARGLEPAMITAALSAIYVLVMFFVIRPLVRRVEKVYDRQGRLSQNVVAVIFLLILASAWTTEAIGIHALFGADSAAEVERRARAFSALFDTV